MWFYAKWAIKNELTNAFDRIIIRYKPIYKTRGSYRWSRHMDVEVQWSIIRILIYLKMLIRGDRWTFFFKHRTTKKV